MQRVRVDGVCYTYSDRPVLSNLELDFGVGVTAIVGPNGAGKSTLMSLLATRIRPDVGAITYGGDEALPHRPRLVRKQIGWLPQGLRYPNSSVADFVAYVAWLKGVQRRDRREATSRAIEVVGLRKRSDHLLSTLSSGMRKRVGIAQAIVNDPGLLLLDEPTAGLDPDQRESFCRLIAGLGDSTIVVVATHLLQDVALCADRMVVLNEGTVRRDTILSSDGDSARPSVEALGRIFRGSATS